MGTHADLPCVPVCMRESCNNDWLRRQRANQQPAGEETEAETAPKEEGSAAAARADADAKPERRLRKSASKILRLKQVRAPTMVAGGGALASLHAAGTSTHDMRKVQGAAAVPDLREAASAAHANIGN